MNEQTLIKRLVIALVAVLLIGAMVWFFFIRDDGKQTSMIGEDTPGTSQPVAEPDNKPSQQGSGQPSGGVSPGSTTQPSGNAQNSNQQLANVGPGDTIGLFLVASAIGAGTHYVWRRTTNRLSMN